MSRGKSLLDRASVAVATCLYLSYIPFWLTRGARFAEKRRWTGAGFLGAAAGWGALGLFPEHGAASAAVLCAAVYASCAVCGRAQTVLGTHDDSRIILDETVGYWAAVAWLPREPALLLAGFILFRFFDAAKLPPYNALERLPGGYGVVMDDVGAGAATNLCLRLLCLAFPGWLCP